MGSNLCIDVISVSRVPVRWDRSTLNAVGSEEYVDIALPDVELVAGRKIGVAARADNGPGFD